MLSAVAVGAPREELSWERGSGVKDLYMCRLRGEL